MIKLDEEYSDYTDMTDENFPGGKAVNASSSETPDGTPILASLINDIMGARQAIYKEAYGSLSGVSGNPDNVSASDILNAIKYLINTPDTNHAALRGENAHGAKVAAEPGQLIARSDTGTAQVTDPVEDEDIVNLNYLTEYVEDEKAVLKSNMFGNGSATVDNSTGLISVTLTNYPDVTDLEEGARFRIVFTNDASYDGSYTMSVNGGTAKAVTVGNVAAGIGWAQSGKSYEMMYTGDTSASYDCLSPKEWYLYKSFSGSTTITLPTNWNELILYVGYSKGSLSYTTMHHLINSSSTFKSTNTFWVGANANVSSRIVVNTTANTIAIAEAYIDNSYILPYTNNLLYIR